MRIALINPPPWRYNEPRYDLPEFTHLGLACLAAYLRKKGYTELLLIDAKFERIGYQEIKHRLLQFQPDIAGHTALTNEIVQAGRTAALVRSVSHELKKKIVNIIGGVHVTALPEQTMKEFSQFDIGVVGEGEQTIVELVQAIEGAGRDLNNIAGLVYRNPHSPAFYINTASRPAIKNLSTLPMPAWDLLPQSSSYVVMSARGCPFSCNFCMNPNGKITRERNVSRFLDEIKWIMEERGGKHIYICDEILTLNKSRAIEILDGLIDMGFGADRDCTFDAMSHVSYIDEELLEKIKKAGCRRLGLGIETGNPETLKFMGKGVSMKNIQKVIDIAKRCKVDLETYFILGQPNETLLTAWKSVWFAARINPEIPVFGIMVPYPGTKIWEWAIQGKNGYQLKSTDWNDFNKQLGNALELEHISRRQIEIIQFLGYIMVFAIHFRFIDLIKFLWRYKTEGWILVKKIVWGKLS